MNKIKIEMFQNAYSNFYSLCYHYCDVYKMDKKIEIKKLYIILKICTHFGIQFILRPLGIEETVKKNMQIFIFLKKRIKINKN